MRLTTRIAMPLALATALVALPATAHAYDRPTGTYCTTSGACYETRATDEYAQSIYVKSHSADSGWGNLETHTGRYYVSNVPGCVYAYRSPEQWAQAGSPRASNICVKGYLVEVITHTFTRWRFPDIPESDKRSGALQPIVLSIVEWRVAGQRPVDHPELESASIAEGSSEQAYCQAYSVASESLPDEYTGSRAAVARDTTPDSVMQACGYTVRLADVRNGPDRPTGDGSGTTTPVQRCGTVTAGPRRLDVTATKASCVVAKRTVLRWTSRNASPSGWNCRVARGTSVSRLTCRSTRAKDVAVGATWKNPPQLSTGLAARWALRAIRRHFGEIPDVVVKPSSCTVPDGNGRTATCSTTYRVGDYFNRARVVLTATRTRNGSFTTIDARGTTTSTSEYPDNLGETRTLRWRTRIDA